MQESDLRNRLSEALKSFNLKQVQVARDTGINNATLSLWLSGKIKGSTAKLDTAIEAWLSTLSNARPKEPVALAADCSRFHRLVQRLNEQGTEPSELVPIRIDVEKDGRRIHEAFCWNVQEPYFTPEAFAALLCEDLSLCSLSSMKLRIASGSSSGGMSAIDPWCHSTSKHSKSTTLPSRTGSCGILTTDGTAQRRLPSASAWA